MQLCEARAEYVRWLVATRDLSRHTIRAYSNDIDTLVRHLGVRASVSEINSDTLLGFVEDQRAEGLSSTSVKRRISGLRGF